MGHNGRTVLWTSRPRNLASLPISDCLAQSCHQTAATSSTGYLTRCAVMIKTTSHDIWAGLLTRPVSARQGFRDRAYRSQKWRFVKHGGRPGPCRHPIGEGQSPTCRGLATLASLVIARSRPLAGPCKRFHGHDNGSCASSFRRQCRDAIRAAKFKLRMTRHTAHGTPPYRAYIQAVRVAASPSPARLRWGDRQSYLISHRGHHCALLSYALMHAQNDIRVTHLEVWKDGCSMMHLRIMITPDRSHRESLLSLSSAR